jgi:CheY-like chemotaxis protein
MLRDLGYRVLEAADGAAAIAVLQSGQPITLLFTDVIMPGPVNCQMLVATARQLVPGTKVLFTSGYTEDSIVHHGRLDEGVQLLSKPYRFEQLAAKIRAVLADPVPDP